MAIFATIPKDEAEPLVAAAPKAASPKFKVTAAAICLACAVAGYQAPSETEKFCIGGTEGSVKDSKLVFSDKCSTGYKVKIV